MSHKRILELDPLIHAPVRLAVMSLLVTVDGASFAFLKESTKATDGNLSTHLAKLEKGGYVTIKKTFKGKKPHTSCAVTKKGRNAFVRYLDSLEEIVMSQKQE